MGAELRLSLSAFGDFVLGGRVKVSFIGNRSKH